ncbi:predicted protein [Lichtheimia corymbifera JMRC:FSU:9682]|uniref:Uncharacterized protein n=1 Tax=Lichtheimia corymbifera JMRC:FSU:9682 TaxID=1263082 RepID=A0A068S0F8_9FUNG|nr:predicted protein [Lichtheimia corymbifera JMRC:FSU:9682]
MHLPSFLLRAQEFIRPSCAYKHDECCHPSCYFHISLPSYESLTTDKPKLVISLLLVTLIDYMQMALLMSFLNTNARRWIYFKTGLFCSYDKRTGVCKVLLTQLYGTMYTTSDHRHHPAYDPVKRVE